MQQLLRLPWFTRTLVLTAVAALLTFVPVSPLGLMGGAALLTILPGAQLVRWLGLYSDRWNFSLLALSLALGLVSSPVLLYWSGLLFGFSRGALLIIFPLYIIALAGWVSRGDLSPLSRSAPQPSGGRWPLRALIPALTRTRLIAALFIGFTALGVWLAYLELETAQGYYPVQMEDWQKHYGVAFALRQTGIPPTSLFFYGMFPQEKLIYYYFLHLSGAALDLLQNGPPFLSQAFVLTIVLASLAFTSLFFVLARTLWRSRPAALWSLAFVTIIGGLDVIPIIERTIRKYREHFPEGPIPAGVFLPREHIDNWVSVLSLRLNTFYTHQVWVPQHLTGLTIICLGCYLYLKVKDRRKLWLILPLLLFALLGHSTWIALMTFGCLFLFAGLQIFSAFRKHGLAAARTLFLSYALIALIFSIVAAPFIWSLVGPGAPKSGIAFEIPKLDSWSILHPIQAAFGPTLWARVLDLPLHFLIELGPLLVAGLAGLILFWRRTYRLVPTPHLPHPHTLLPDQAGLSNPPLPHSHPLLPHSHTLLPHPHTLLPFWTLLLVTGLLTVSLFASGRAWAELGLIQNNDLGLRALMPGQLTLALFGGYFMACLPSLARPRRWKMIQTATLTLLIGLGLASTGWEFISMGLAKYWTEPQLSPAVYQTLRALPDVTPSQEKPFPVIAHRLYRDAARFQLSLAGRPVVFSTGEAIVFHNEVRDLALAHELSQQAFDNGLPVWSYQMFQNLGADYIFVGPAEREALRHPEKYQHSQYFQRVYRQGDFEIYQVQPPAYQHGRPLARFDGGSIEFEGYFIDLAARYPGDSTPPSPSEGIEDSNPPPSGGTGGANSPPSEEMGGTNPPPSGGSGGPKGLVTAWRLTRPGDKAYTVFIHLVDGEGRLIAQADHQLWAWDVSSEGPTPTWTPGLIHLDITPVPEAALLAAQPLSIRLGLWLPETGQHFPVDPLNLDIDEAGRLVVGELNPASASINRPPPAGD